MSDTVPDLQSWDRRLESLRLHPTPVYSFSTQPSIPRGQLMSSSISKWVMEVMVHCGKILSNIRYPETYEMDTTWPLSSVRHSRTGDFICLPLKDFAKLDRDHLQVIGEIIAHVHQKSPTLHEATSEASSWGSAVHDGQRPYTEEMMELAGMVTIGTVLKRVKSFASSSSRITSDSKYTRRRKPQKLHNAEERYSHSLLKHLRQYHVRHLQTRHVQT